MAIPKQVAEIELSPTSADEYEKDKKIMDELFSEADLVQKKFKEWQQKNGKGPLTLKKQKEMKKELRKIKKKYIAVMKKLEFLQYKNRKEIVKEVDRHGEADN